MRYSTLFGKTVRNVTKDDTTANARLLAKAGYVEKLMSGVYSYLPLGLMVLERISNVVREEIDALGAQRIQMPMLHPKENWVKTGGWESIDVLFKLQSRTNREYALGQSEEEIVVPLVMKRVSTYADLPQIVYQVGWKFRDELRSKSGLLRGREFLMKDMYSFHESQADFEEFYERAKKAYLRIFDRLGLNAKVTEASGGSFSEKISYEFMVVSDAGEDEILSCQACNYCVNLEVAHQDVGSTCPRCGRGRLCQATATEVGNVFDLGTKYGRDFETWFTGREGGKEYPVVGCYGIGISRLMGVVVEASHDDRGVIWPKLIAPALLHMVSIGSDPRVTAEAERIYSLIKSAGFSVLWDDRDESAGVKFTDADLLGLPFRLVVSTRGIESGQLEIKSRQGATLMVDRGSLLSDIAKIQNSLY